MSEEALQKQSNVELLVVDEKSNLFDSLEKLLLFLNQTKREKLSWKWAIIALHGALYGAMILALQGSNYERVLELCRTCKKTRTGKLISFKEAFKWIQQTNKIPKRIGSKKFIPSQEHKKAIHLVDKELRNNFAHFIPQSWLINTKEFPEIFKSCLEIIQFCLFESGNILLLENEKKPYRDLLVKIDTCLNEKIDAPRVAAMTGK